MTKVFILGSADPEMEEIERVVREQGHEVRYATAGFNRVRAETAYDAAHLSASIPPGSKLIFVECAVFGLPRTTVVDHHRPGDPGYNRPPHEYLSGSSLGQVLQLLELEPTELQRIIAAADHCPTQAYKGLCPGVEVAALAEWRTSSRALRRGISNQEMESAIKLAESTLLDAERISFCNESIAWVGDRKGEICEASARYGIPFMYSEPTRDGRVKMGIMGASPLVIDSWMRQCNLNQVYGDPARGYAGGYC
jgi:hypothetical protein